jgi:hypothetical protein
MKAEGTEGGSPGRLSIFTMEGGPVLWVEIRGVKVGNAQPLCDLGSSGLCFAGGAHTASMQSTSGSAYRQALRAKHEDMALAVNWTATAKNVGERGWLKSRRRWRRKKKERKKKEKKKEENKMEMKNKGRPATCKYFDRDFWAKAVVI